MFDFADPTRPEEVNPTVPREEPNDNSKDVEMNSVTIRPSSSTSPDPTSPESSSETVPLAIWIAAATVALLIIVFVGITIAVCCVVLKSRAGKNHALPTEGVHYYDYIDSHGIYSLAHGPRTPTTTAAIHRLAEEDDGTELEYVQMASTSDHQAQSLQTFSGGLDTGVPPEETEPYYTIIDGEDRPSVTATGDEEKRTNTIEMTTNMAYPAIRDNFFEDSGEYI